MKLYSVRFVDIDAILDGDLDGLITAYLRSLVGKEE